jgi:hypothetical protein
MPSACARSITESESLMIPPTLQVPSDGKPGIESDGLGEGSQKLGNDSLARIQMDAKTGSTSRPCRVLHPTERVPMDHPISEFSLGCRSCGMKGVHPLLTSTPYLIPL